MRKSYNEHVLHFIGEPIQFLPHNILYRTAILLGDGFYIARIEEKLCHQGCISGHGVQIYERQEKRIRDKELHHI